MQSEQVMPSDSVSNASPVEDAGISSDSFDSLIVIARALVQNMGPIPRGVESFPTFVESLRASSLQSPGSVVESYLSLQHEVMRVYAEGMSNVTKLLSFITAAGISSDESPSQSAVVPRRRVRKQTSFPGYKLPLSYDALVNLHKSIGQTPFGSGFENLQSKYARGFSNGTSFSIHEFGSRGSSMASSNFVPQPAGRCYMSIIAGGHKIAARKLLGDNPTIWKVLSLPAHMISVSSLFKFRASRSDFFSFHVEQEGTYSVAALFGRYIQCYSYVMEVASSTWDGTLLQGLTSRKDFADTTITCTETMPRFVTLGGGSHRDVDATPTATQSSEALAGFSFLSAGNCNRASLASTASTDYDRYEDTEVLGISEVLNASEVSEASQVSQVSLAGLAVSSTEGSTDEGQVLDHAAYIEGGGHLSDSSRGYRSGSGVLHARLHCKSKSRVKAAIRATQLMAVAARVWSSHGNTPSRFYLYHGLYKTDVFISVVFPSRVMAQVSAVELASMGRYGAGVTLMSVSATTGYVDLSAVPGGDPNHRTCGFVCEVSSDKAATDEFVAAVSSWCIASHCSQPAVMYYFGCGGNLDRVEFQFTSVRMVDVKACRAEVVEKRVGRGVVTCHYVAPREVSAP